MNDSDRRGRDRLFALLPHAVSVVAIAMGVLVLLGWLFNVDSWKGVFPGLTFMKANTALGFIMSGLALWGTQASSQAGRWRPVTQVSSGLVLLLGLLTLGEYLSGVDLGIDQLLIRETAIPPGDIPGRMATNTALSFAALGAALLLLGRGKGNLVIAIHALLLIPALAAGSALIGYGYDIEEFLRAKLNYTPMAFATAAVFVVLVFGIATARRDFPCRRFISSDSAAGVMVRRLLPTVIAFTLLIGWLIQQGYDAGYVSEVFGLALFSATSIAGLTALILWAAGIFDAADRQRKRAESKLKERVKELQAFYALSELSERKDMILERLYQELVTILPNSWQYPEIACARIVMGDCEFSTDNFRDSDWMQMAPIQVHGSSVGKIEVGYLELKPMEDEGPFLKEERRLLNAIAERVGNITEHRQSEEALQRSAEEIEDLYNHAPIGYHSVNNDGTIVRINDTELSWLGYTRGEVIGKKNFADLLTPESLKTFRATFAESRARGWVSDLEYELVRKDGTILPVLLSATAVRDARGNFLMSRSTIYDITERKKLGAHIRQAAAYTRSLIEASLDPLVTISADGKITDVNEATIQATGISRETLIGSDFSDYFTDPGAAREGYRQVFERGTVRDYPLAIRHRDGHVTHVVYNATIYRNEAGEVQGVFAAARDVTARLLLEEDLRKLNQDLKRRVEEEVALNREKDLILMQQARLAAMGEMIHNIAHQWRQPLNALSLILSDIKEEYESEETDADYLKTSIASGHQLIKQMSSTIDDFRNFFRPDREMSEFDIRRSVEDAIFVMEATFRNNSIVVEKELSEGLIAYGYPNQFAQVILNLLANAKDAIQTCRSSGGQIHIRLTRIGEKGILTMEDDGGGIPEEILPRIFDPYFTTKPKGSGIGLYMSQMIIERNLNGTIEATNTEKGALFTITLTLMNKEVPRDLQ